MNIKIKENDYVQPTEVRENVVQTLCNIILEDYLDRVSSSITIYVKSAELYIGTHKRYEFDKDTAAPFVITRSTLNQNYTYIRVHSCEMDEALRLFRMQVITSILSATRRQRVLTTDSQRSLCLTAWLQRTLSLTYSLISITSKRKDLYGDFYFPRTYRLGFVWRFSQEWWQTFIICHYYQFN